MKKVIASLALLLVFASSASAQEDWEIELGEDLVEIQDGMMIIEDYALFKINLENYDPVSLQIKFRGEAPENGIVSRDKFVSVTTLTTYQVLYESFAQAYQVTSNQFSQATEIDDLANPIGTPDLEIGLFLTDEGMQIEFVNTSTGDRNRMTRTWEEVYAN